MVILKREWVYIVPGEGNQSYVYYKGTIQVFIIFLIRLWSGQFSGHRLRYKQYTDDTLVYPGIE